MLRRQKSKDIWLDIKSYEQHKLPYENPQADVDLLDWEANSMAPIQLKEWPVASADWDTKTLVDDGPDADRVAPIELEERPHNPVLYCAFCR